MTELNAIYLDRRSRNTCYIFFDDYAKAMKWKKVLQALFIDTVEFVIISNKKRYYGFRMLHIRKRLFTLCVELKEVIGCEKMR